MRHSMHAFSAPRAGVPLAACSQCPKPRALAAKPPVAPANASLSGRSNTCRARRGFTLIEVVLAVSLSLALVVAILAFYKQVTDVRAVVRAEAQIISDEQTIMGLMTQDLRSALVSALAALAIDGGASGQVRMATASLPGGISWVVQQATATEQYPPQPDVQIVGYRLRVEEDDQGQPVITGLERTCQRTPTLRTAEEGVDIQVTLLSSGMRFLYLRYWDGAAWQESWTTGDLPGAVEITLGREPLPDGSDPAEYPHSVYRRVVCVPAGVKPPSSTTVVGLVSGGG